MHLLKHLLLVQLMSIASLAPSRGSSELELSRHSDCCRSRSVLILRSSRLFSLFRESLFVVEGALHLSMNTGPHLVAFAVALRLVHLDSAELARHLAHHEPLVGVEAPSSRRARSRLPLCILVRHLMGAETSQVMVALVVNGASSLREKVATSSAGP